MIFDAANRFCIVFIVAVEIVVAVATAAVAVIVIVLKQFQSTRPSFVGTLKQPPKGDGIGTASDLVVERSVEIPSTAVNQEQENGGLSQRSASE